MIPAVTRLPGHTISGDHPPAQVLELELAAASYRSDHNQVVIIRSRSTSDGAALEAIATQTHRLDSYPVYLPGDLKSFIMNDDALGAWVASTDGEVLGHVALHRSTAEEVMDVVRSATGMTDDNFAVVARLLVAPTARRQGIGRALLATATHAAFSLRRRAVLDVVDVHEAAIALYEDCGWTRVGRVEWTLPGDLPLREFIYLSPDLTPPEGAREK